MTTEVNAQPEQETVTPKPALQTNHNELSYEHSIAYHIVGKLVLDGALDPTNYNFENGTGGLPFVVNSIAQALLDGLAAFGWQDGVAELINAASLGVLHMRPKEGAQ